jgi:integrase/recombinase XerD
VRIHAAAEPSAEALLERFLEELRRRRYSTSLIEQAQHVLPRFLSHLRERHVRDLRAVTETHVEAYLRHLAQTPTKYGRPPALATQLIHLALIRRFFRFLYCRRWLLADPTGDLALPRPDSLPRTVLSRAQARQLICASQRFNGRWWWPHVETRDRALLELLYGTGIRKSECIRLDVGDLDLLQGELLVRNGKGRKDRLVPIPGRAALALDTYLREARPAFVKDHRQAALFTSWQGERLKPVSLVALLKRRAQAARLPVALSPHLLRHTCATHLLRGGADVRHVQELLGHAHLDSTARYTRVALADLAQVLERAHPREREWARRRRPAR